MLAFDLTYQKPRWRKRRLGLILSKLAFFRLSLGHDNHPPQYSNLTMIINDYLIYDTVSFLFK